MSYLVEEKARITAWYECTRSVIVVQRKFRSEYGRNRVAPSGAAIRKWHKKFLSTGSIQGSVRKREKTISTPENVSRVVEHFHEDPHSSIRRASSSLSLSLSSVQRILKTARWHPYKVQVLQKLHEEDLANRVEFAHDELDRISGDPNHLKFLIFSDEANFHLDGGFNRHNHRYWAPSNPQWVKEESLHSARITVWAAIWEGGHFGPFFFDGNVNADSYLQMLRDQFWPQLVSAGFAGEAIFMQDGAPPHWGRAVRLWLDQMFQGRWIGRGSPNMPWPPRSPDLTPCDFFLWGFVKSQVYRSRPNDIEDLKSRIIAAFEGLTARTLRKVMVAYRTRLQSVIDNDGSHIEVIP